MSIAFVYLGWTFLFKTPFAAELSVCTGVGGCGCPISCRVSQIYTVSLALMYNAPSSASVADNITVLTLMICATLRMAPLFCGGVNVAY